MKPSTNKDTKSKRENIYLWATIGVSAFVFLLAALWSFCAKAFDGGETAIRRLLITGDFLSFVGATILGISVFLQEKLYHQREIEQATKEEEEKIKQSAYAVYWDFKHAFTNLAPLYHELLTPDKNNQTKPDNQTKADLLTKALQTNITGDTTNITVAWLKTNLSPMFDTAKIYFLDNWMANTANLLPCNFSNGVTVDQMFRIYQYLSDFNHLLECYERFFHEDNKNVRILVPYIIHLVDYFSKDNEGKCKIDVYLIELKKAAGNIEDSASISSLWDNLST